MLSIFKRNNKKVENLTSIKMDEEKQSIKSFEEYAKEQQSKDDESLKDCLNDLSTFKTLDKSDKLIFITDENSKIIGKTNLKFLKTLFECNFINKIPYSESYSGKTYNGFDYESRRMRIYMTNNGTTIFSDYSGNGFWTINQISKIQDTISKITNFREFIKNGVCDNKNIIKVNLLVDNLSPDCRELYYYIKDI